MRVLCGFRLLLSKQFVFILGLRGFRVQGLGFRIQGLGFSDKGLIIGFRDVEGSGLRVQGLGLRV